MTQLTLPGSGWLLSKGIALQVAYCHTSAKILGYDRNRDLIWDTVTSRITKEEKECLHIWTTRGDCPLVPSTKLSTTLGVITAAKLANVVRSGEDIRVEVPRMKPVEGLVGAPTSSGAAALLRPRLLPFRCTGKPVLRVHTSSLQSLAEMLVEARCQAEEARSGRFLELDSAPR